MVAFLFYFILFFFINILWFLVQVHVNGIQGIRTIEILHLPYIFAI